MSFLLLFFLILLPLHPSPLKRIIYNSVTTLFHLPSVSSVGVKAPPISRVNCFQLFCFITCTYMFMWRYYTSESISCSHFLWFHPGKGSVYPNIVDAMPLISDVNIFLRFLSGAWLVQSTAWWSPAAEGWWWQFQQNTFLHLGVNFGYECAWASWPS